MNIGLFTDSYLPLQDGVATTVTSLAKEFEQKRHDVYIIAPNHPKAYDHDRIYRIFSIPISKKPEFRAGIQIPQPSLLKISAIHFDIIHGHTSGPISLLGWQFARFRRIPFVKTYHTFWKYYSHYFVFSELLQPWMIEKSSALFANASHAVIAPTEKVKQELISLKVKKPVYVVPNGISI